MQRLQCQFDQRMDSLTVRCGNRMHGAQTQLKELDQLRASKHTLGLVGGEDTGFTKTAQVLGNLVILRRNTFARIDHKDDHIGFCHRLARLFGHLLENATDRVGLETTGVNDNEFLCALSPVAIVTVPGQSGKVGHDRIARFGQAIEQRRFTNVGTADEGQDRFHRRASNTYSGLKPKTPPLRVATTSVPPAKAGAVARPEPSVAMRVSAEPSSRESQ